MTTLEQAARQALEALENRFNPKGFGEMDKAIDALRQALEQKQEPEFFTHNVEQPFDWSEWVCPDPKSYLMKCCDCGLVHEAEFGVVRYKSDNEREDCDIVDDPNLQAVFRMRRSEQWSSEDTAHRAGGLPMAQPEQKPVAWCVIENGRIKGLCKSRPAVMNADKWQPLHTEPLKREWVGLTDAQIYAVAANIWGSALIAPQSYQLFARAIEAKLWEKNT